MNIIKVAVGEQNKHFQSADLMLKLSLESTFIYTIQ